MLIVEVLVNRAAQQSEDEDNQKMKFTFSKEDLMEVSIHELACKHLLIFIDVCRYLDNLAALSMLSYLTKTNAHM